MKKKPQISNIFPLDKGKKISRKEALVKTGKFAAFSAATMITLLSTTKSAHASPL